MTLDIQAIAAQIQQNVPEVGKGDFGEVVDMSYQIFCETTPNHSQEVREAWVAAIAWVLSVLIASMKEQLSARELAVVIKTNLSSMVVAIAADEAKAKAAELIRERLQAAVDASQSFWEE